MSGTCLSIIRFLTSAAPPSSGMSALTWTNPPRMVRGMSRKVQPGHRERKRTRVLRAECGDRVLGGFPPPSTLEPQHPLSAPSPQHPFTLRYTARSPPEEPDMAPQLSTVFTGLRFANPFLLSSAPPTESDINIMRAFDAGWSGVVTKTIGLHPVVNVKGPKTKFMRAENNGYRMSMSKRPDSTLIASWNWELISDKPMDWWIGKLSRIKKAYPKHILVASIMAGSGNDKELHNWQSLTKACQDEGCDALELNFSCPHMDRVDMGSNVGKDKVLCSVVTQAVKEVAKVPVWVKLTPATADIAEEAAASFRGGADAISSSNTFPSLPLIDPNTLDFEMSVDGIVSSGGLGGPAILPLSLAKMSQMTKAFPNKAFSGIGGVANFDHAL